jgi:REP element-mobilizing transposase RayT
MPRLPRIDAPGVIHHVIIRGIEKRAIFQDKTDYEDFLKRVEALIPETQTRCYAWVLMTNHAHFLFRCGPKGLPNLMQRLLTGYVVRFNRHNRRYGQLFRNRCKSIMALQPMSCFGKAKGAKSPKRGDCSAIGAGRSLGSP